MVESAFLNRIEFRQEALPPLSVLEAEWRGLEIAAQPSFFNSWYWIGTFLTALPESKRPSLLRGSVRGVTVALALIGARIARRHHGLLRSRALYVNETGDPNFDLAIEHNGLLVAPAAQKAALDALVEWFFEHNSEADELHLRGWTQPIAEAVFARTGLGRSVLAVPSYWVDLGHLAASDGQLYAVLSSNARQQLRRAIRHFEAFGELRLEQPKKLAEAHAFFSELKQLHIERWDGRNKPHSFSREFFELFHRLLLDRHLRDGVIELHRASAATRVIGYLYNFRFLGRVYSYQSGFAYRGGSARPGAVTHALAIRDAYTSGATVYDFLAGHNRLKASYATASAHMHWDAIQQPRLALRAERLARQVNELVQCQFGKLRRWKNMLSPGRELDTGSRLEQDLGGAVMSPDHNHH